MPENELQRVIIDALCEQWNKGSDSRRAKEIHIVHKDVPSLIEYDFYEIEKELESLQKRLHLFTIVYASDGFDQAQPNRHYSEKLFNRNGDILLSITPKFEKYFSEYLLRRDSTLDKMSKLNIEKIYNTVLDIDEKLQIQQSHEIALPIKFHNTTPLLHDHIHTLGKSMEFRRDVLEYLRIHSVITSFTVDNLADCINIDIDIRKFKAFKRKLAKFHTGKLQTQKTIAQEPSVETVEPPSPEEHGKGSIFPAGTTWEKVTISFISEDSINVKTSGYNETFDYKGMGLLDKRKNEPNKQWSLLRLLAMRGGQITVDDLSEAKGKTHAAFSEISFMKGRLAKTLKSFFGMTDAPFHPYDSTSEKALRMKCIINDIK